MSELPDRVSEPSEVIPPPRRGFDRRPYKAGDLPKTRVSRKRHFNTSHSKSSLFHRMKQLPKMSHSEPEF